MRERTPSADDTPKRAPPAPPREAASADVAGSKTSSEAAEAFRAAKFSSTTASPTAASTTTASSPTDVDARMVASTHNLDDLGVSHPASASTDRQQQQEKHAHTYRSAQTAQDKRSRLSNVINNLRKKVPDSRSGDSPRKEEDDRNSVERNLETLEKYVMTVLNGVIKDEENDDREVGRKKETEKGKESEKLTEDQEDEDSKGPVAKFEPSKPNESRTEAAVFLMEHAERTEGLGSGAGKEADLECMKLDDKEARVQQTEESSFLEVKESQEDLCNDLSEENKSCETETVEDEEVFEGNKCSSKETRPEDQSVQEIAQHEGREEERTESKSLGTIIMERLSDHQSEDKGNNDASKEDTRELVSENAELRNVCRDLLNDLLNGINQLIDENSQEKEEVRTLDASSEESKDSKSQDLSMTSLHCSLPLDKVASVLQNCQPSELTVPQSPSSPSSSSSSSQGSKSPSKPPSPIVRHLCLYCDRKFLSISLRQRHTERVHQQGGGRRSERNSRKPSQNCQYCSDKCAESLEGLFHHMVGSHGDKYHACVQCSTRYLTREALTGHMIENHGVNAERNLQIQEKMKEPSPSKELGSQSPRDKAEPLSSKDKKLEDSDHGIPEHRTESILLKPPIVPPKDAFSNPGSPEFDSSFYSSVSCNIRENLLHHLDGKLQSSSSPVTSTTSSIVDSKSQQQQTLYEHNINQIQFPIDISLTAATPVYSKEYTNEEYENSSEYAQKPGKSNRSHPRRVSFEKYNFPRKYDGKEQWTCSIKDLSKFDISTQLTLRKKQQLLKERVTLSRLRHIPILGPSETTDIAQDEQNASSEQSAESENVEEASSGRNNGEVEQVSRCDALKSTEAKTEASEVKSSQTTEFSAEFGSFLRLRKWDEKASTDMAKKQEAEYAELTGEWSRPRVYICGACATKHVTLREMEDHKSLSHPNVWCSHFEFSGDQRELYKHVFLPGRNMPTAKAKTAVLAEKVCTKCSKNCNTLPELHRHMLECGGDQAWLLGLFGNGKKKCKWRPFGSRSRRRRQRGMKRNIQNSQTPRVTTAKEKQPTGPRVRPSDRESIQKMLANLPPKRATRKVMQDSTLRAQGRLRNVQTRSRPRMVGDNTTASRMSRNKAALRNKLLKNAKSIQRHRCRIDNISAVIESVVGNYNAEEKKSDGEKNQEEKSVIKKDAKEKTEESVRKETELDERSNRTKMVRGPRVLSKKRNVKTKEGTIRSVEQTRRMGNVKGRVKSTSKNALESKSHSPEDALGTSKSARASPKGAEKEIDEFSPATSPVELKSPSPSAKNRSFVQTTPRRKRPVDPVASLNASIKAKSQLRTQDGKFARNPNKSLSPQKSPEIRPPIAGRQWVKGRNSETSPESSVTRSKWRTVSRSKKDDQLPKRTTRLSSDSDKMPTLEPADQVTSNSEEYVDATANDLPILSPATSSSSSDKAVRGKSLITKQMEEKDSLKKGNEGEGTERKNEVAGDLNEEDKDQRQGKPRRGKGDGKNLERSLKSIVSKGDVSKEKPKGFNKEKLKRRSAPARILNAEEKKNALKSPEETKKEFRHRKEDGRMKTLETRSNSKTRLDNILDADGQIKIQNVPFEVKKLIGSDSKEDLLTKLVLTSRTATSKRCLRQSAPKANVEQAKSKTRTDFEAEKASLDSEFSSTASTGSGKKETVGLRRKSLRKIEKKSEEKTVPKDDKSVAEETNRSRNAASEGKTLIRGRRSSSLSGENKSVVNANQVSPFESENKAETELTIQNTDNENSSNKRQTRGSVLNNETDAQSKENNSEQRDMSPEKSNYLGKRRGRIKSNNDAPDKSNSEVSQEKDEESIKNNLTEITDKINAVEENKAKPVDNEATIPEDNNASEDKEEKDRSDVKAERSEGVPSESAATPNVNLSLNHLQLETSSSMDSGKENSLETVVGVQKSKVGRPRKSWGSRRERTSKRSLNNVIGILTEGMNIPVESQQSVVLTVQTTLDNASPDSALQNNAQQSDDGSSKFLNLDKIDKSSENANSTGNLVEEARSCVPNPEGSSKEMQTAEVPVEELSTEDSLANIQKVDTPSNDAKEQPPTNDIILDLSRRKPKGKGSFLEKIVSKIAKQKDALLEGEVGSLLDTAADELTSILDEVGPGLSETADNLTEAKTRVGKLKTERKIQDTRQEVKKKSVDKDFSSSNGSDRKLENKDTRTGQFQAIESEEKKVLLKEEKSSKETLNDAKSINQKEMKDETIGHSDQDATDRQVETLEAQKVGNSDDLKLEDRIPPVEINSVSNSILLSASESVPESTPNCSAETCSPKQEESVKQDEEAVTEDSKSKRKSKKRSLEGSSPKKNKRKSVEPADESEENELLDELHLADIMKLIDKSKQVPSTKENAEDSFPEAAVERVQFGKRKTESNDPEVKDLTNNAIEHTQTIDDSVHVKKIKIDNAKDVIEPIEVNQDGKIVVEEDSTEGPVNASNDKICTDNDETDSPLSQITEKRKSVETVEQCPETDSPARRSSNRRSVPEEKLNQPSEEETLSKIELPANETISGSSRRRSSRMKSTVQQKNEEKNKKETQDDSDCSNTAVTLNSELPLNATVEKDESLENNASLVQTTLLSAADETNKIAESSTPSIAQNYETSKDGVVEGISETDLKDSEAVLETPIIPKVAKKRGRKKKVPANEQTQIANDFPEENSNSKVEAEPIDEIPDRKSSRTSRANEEIEKEGKNSSSTATSHIPSPSLEHFKIPEVTDILQHTKKRTSKRKSIIDEHPDTQSAPLSVESEANTAELSEVSKTVAEKEERLENKDQKDTSGGRRRLSRNSNREKLEWERSSSSGSIDLVQSSRTRSSKRKQLSSEDLLSQEGLNRRAESVDSLSETSVVSESSYFRKKRFSKKKKGFQAPSDDVQTDTSITDSESIDTERNSDRRQSLKRRAKKNISFFELQFDLVDDFDIPMDIEECLQPEDSLKNVDQPLESKSSRVEDKVGNETCLNDASDREHKEDRIVADPKQTDEEEKDESVEAENADIKVDAAPEVQDDFQTPKKRAAGNFVVVHKKTGEILIVEKRKKLTKEAAKFFCDVCATSFTRKSSLKKHNLSQSHLLQLVKSKKDKTFSESIEDTCNDSWKETSDQNEAYNEENTSVSSELISGNEESKEDQEDFKSNSKDFEADRNISNCRTSIEQESLIASRTTEQHIVEDELLDEEICKITENMSHDEYVLTEHSSPTPESSSTPIKIEIKKTEDTTKKKKHDKKKEKAKKKNLAEEHFDLDSTEPKTPLNLTSGSLLSVLGPNMSIKISKSLPSSASESLVSKTEVSESIEAVSALADSSKNVESETDVCVLKEDSLKEMCPNSTDGLVSEKSHNLNLEVDNVRKSIEQTREQSVEVELEEDLVEMMENIPKSVSDDIVVSKEDQPHERISLKLIINKRSIEQFKEADTEINRSPDLNYSEKAEDVGGLNSYSSQCSVQRECIEDTNYSKPKINQHDTDLNSTLSETLEEENKRSLANAVEDSNVSKETLQTTDIARTLEEDGVEASQTVLSNLYEQQILMVADSTIEDIPGLQSESNRSSRHGKVKKNKVKKHVEEIENLSADCLTSRKTSKLKGNHHKQTLDEVMKSSGTANNQASNECSETFEYKIIDKTDSKKPECLENNSDKVSNSISFAEPKSEARYKPNALDIEDQQNLYSNSTDVPQMRKGEGNDHNVDSESKIKCQLTVEEDDTSSSIEDKPLSQVLLKVDEKLKEDKKQKRERNLSINSLECSEESKVEGDKHTKATFDVDENSATNNQRPDTNELMNGDQVQYQIAYEEKCKPETLNPVKTSDKNTKVLSESENSETIQQVKDISNEKEAKAISSDRKSSGKKASKSHKHSSKDSHRRLKSKKTSLKNKIADLVSESDDSEYEDKIGSQNKSKIVKSVFGRVFGAEKTDKVKEVLNDWVSKSEDDSDISRSEFKSFSPNELKTREVSEAKSEGKNVERQTTSSIFTSQKKCSGKKSKKSSSSDKAKEKTLESEDQLDSRPDKHKESQSNSNNRRKNNADMEALLRRHYIGEILPPTSHRSSKKKAKKRITEEVLSFDNFFDRMDSKFNWGSKSEDDSDASRSEFKPSSPNELRTREISEARPEKGMERQSNPLSVSSSPKKRSGKKSKKSSSDRTKEKDPVPEGLEDHRSDKATVSKDNSVDHRKTDMDTENDYSEIASSTYYKSSKKKARKRTSESRLPIGTLFESMETKDDWESKSEDDLDVSRNQFEPSSPGELNTRESSEARSEGKTVENHSTSSSSKKCSGKKLKKGSSLDRAKEKYLMVEDQENSRFDKHTESHNNFNNRKRSSTDMELSLQRHLVGEIVPPATCRSSKKKAKKRVSKDLLSLGTLFEQMDAKFNWGSKSEDDSDVSKDEPSSPSELKAREISEARSEKDMERQSNSSPVSASPRKRSGKKSKKSSSLEKTKDKNPMFKNQEGRRSDKHTEEKNNLTNRKKNGTNVEDDVGEILPSAGYRNSKKRAEERISKSFLPLDYIYETKEPSELRNQQKSDLTVKDSGYGSFNYDEDSSKLMSLESSTEDQRVTKKRKSDVLVTEKKTTKNSKESDDENALSVKDLSRGENSTNLLSVDLESSHSCSSLALSSVRNRSPSMDRNSQTTKGSDVDEEDRDEEELGHRRISPLFACGTPRNSISSSSNSENEEEEDTVTAAGTAARKRSSSEFSGEKIVIRSPSSTHKTEVVTIAPTDAIEDNALDVPREIETAEPRQGKVLNFDEELFVECCSRLKATTENELRGAKKIKLDHNEGYHKKDDQQEGLKGPRDRWRDVESQNSLGSLLESVNQLLGEEMYSTRERDYPKRGGRNMRSEYSSRSASPDVSRVDNLGYEDSLDVAFEHNNKLRDKIQKRIRESESLIASTFGQKSSNEIVDDDKRPSKHDHQETLRTSYARLDDQEHLSGTNLSNGDYSDNLHVRNLQEQQSPKKMSLESSGFKNRMNSALGGLLDKALSNLLHSNGKNDHNGSTPMKVLAELACARAPTSTAGDSTSQDDIQSVKTTPNKDSVPSPAPLTAAKDLQKKIRNPIKELFERKKEMNERKHQEKSKTEAALRELNVHRQRKTKKAKKHQEFPLIRRNEHGGLVERKKRRDGFERKEEFVSGRIKDVYEFDEEESQIEPNLGSVMSYRTRPGYEVNCLKTKEVDVAELMSKAIGDSLENGKTGDPLSSRLESIIDRKFKELEKFAPKTKGALKAFQSEEQRHMTGPMDEFVERKQSQSKRPPEQTLKHPKLKKRNKNPKKKNRNAWYENDSSDEYRTAVKAEDVGVGISKSQRTCSKGKQNIFAELYTSSESDFENEGVDYETQRQKKVQKDTRQIQELENIEQNEELINKYCSEDEDHVDEWGNEDLKDDANKNDCDNKKSESEMSDHPLVIDERKDMDDQRNSDEETENQYERNFDLDDLYRDDSSVVDSDIEGSAVTKTGTVPDESRIKNTNLSKQKLNDKVDYMQEDDLIPLEEALDLLDQADTNLEIKYDNVNKEAVEHIDTVAPIETVDETFHPIEESTEKYSGSVEDQEEEPDNDLLSLPEKLSTNEKPQKESDNLPLHVFLSRKVQESKKRKEQQLKKMQEEQERILMELQPTRRQRKCAIGKQGLLAEISSSDEEINPRDNRKASDRPDHEKARKQKRESKEKRKERYIEKKHEQMIAKEQKAIEEEILRELGKKKESLAQNTTDVSNVTNEPESTEVLEKITQEQKKRHQTKEKQKKPNKVDEDICVRNNSEDLNDLEKQMDPETDHRIEDHHESPGKQKKHSKSPTKPKKNPKGDTKTVTGKKGKNPSSDKSRNRSDSKGSRDKECKSASSKRDSDDEELKTTKSWNKVEEGVGVAIGRRKRAAANQLYYWSSSSDEEEMLEVVPAVEEEEDDRQEQHGWIVGDSHKKMITMLAMEKQLKEKRRRSEDEFEPSKAKSKKHRNSTS